jgi:hypothetical protein
LAASIFITRSESHTKTHFFEVTLLADSVRAGDKYAWVFGRGSLPSEDIVIRDNPVDDLQIEVDFGLRVRIEGNTVSRAHGIGVFTVDSYSAAQEYTIEKNSIFHYECCNGAIAVDLDPPNSSYSSFKSFRILSNQIVYTKYGKVEHGPAIAFGTADNNVHTDGNTWTGS